MESDGGSSTHRCTETAPASDGALGRRPGLVLPLQRNWLTRETDAGAHLAFPFRLDVPRTLANFFRWKAGVLSNRCEAYVTPKRCRLRCNPFGVSSLLRSRLNYTVGTGLPTDICGGHQGARTLHGRISRPSVTSAFRQHSVFTGLLSELKALLIVPHCQLMDGMSLWCADAIMHRHPPAAGM